MRRGEIEGEREGREENHHADQPFPRKRRNFLTVPLNIHWVLDVAIESTFVKLFQFFEANGEVCPANWTPDSPTIKPDPKKSKEYFQKVNK